jgi:hypothetical protein
MPNKERIPVSFWLKDKTVTGLLVAAHAGKKLVSYNGKYFVVSDKTPEKRHYTESTLPASWKNMMAGKPSPSPTSPKAGKAAGETTSTAMEQNSSSRGPQEVDSPAQPALRRSKKKPEKAVRESVVAPKASPQSATRKASLESPKAKAAPELPKAKAAHEPGKEQKASPKGGKERQSAAKGRMAENETVGYFCPYCSTEHSCSADKAGAPFFQQCSKCGKDFGVKITARLVYQAEVAAFK